MSREQQRLARRWAREQIVEAIRGLLLSDWPFDDAEFASFEEDERETRLHAIEEILTTIEAKNDKSSAD